MKNRERVIITLLALFLFIPALVPAAEICQYASSATATSENSGSLAIYAVGAPNAPKVGQCSQWADWSGYGYTWSPVNWDVKATLTLSYNEPVYASTLTVFGDYDICWNKMWLKNSATQQQLLIFEGFDNSCTALKNFNGDFLADTVILETCGWSWSSTDAVKLCGNSLTSPICGNGILEGTEQCDDGNTINGDGCSSNCQLESAVCGNGIVEGNEQCDDGNTINGDGCSSQCLYEVSLQIKICDWQDCHAGAASVSIDDSYTSCRDELNQNGFKGTYYLYQTDDFSSSDWNYWQGVYNEGHEIACHTRNHQCTELDASTLHYEISSNRNDILTNLNIPEEEVSSFAWPCGITNSLMKSVADDYFISARGYHINTLEEKNPADFMEIKSLNTPYYHNPPLAPPDYFDMADLAESQGKWVNFVFHNWCSDDGAINYLATKDLWVAPLGKVAKYIKERQNSHIQNIVETPSQVTFKLTSTLNPTLFNQKITIKVFINPFDVQNVLVNGISTSFTTGPNYIMLNLHPSGNDNIAILTSSVPTECGNGILEPGEQCDDGNTINGDGCSSTCTIEPICGNNIIEGTEECDDGSNNGIVCNPPYGKSCTYCSNSCKQITLQGAYCGDNILNIPYEECDDGNKISGDGCSSSCVLEFCGDGICSATEDVFNCPSDCSPICGNGIIEPGEECDDGILKGGCCNKWCKIRKRCK